MANHKKSRFTEIDNSVYSWDSVPIIITPNLAGDILQLTPQRIRQLCESGEIPAKKIGSSWRITKDDIMQVAGARK